MSRVLLILPTGTYRAEEYLSAAERLGVDVVVGSERAQALAATMGERFLELPLDDPPEAARRIVAHAGRDGRLALDAVLGVDDQGLLTAALASAQLGLAHSPVEAVALTRDKAAMRARFAAAGVPQPDFVVVEGAGGNEVADAAARLGVPVVVKPSSLSASRGVIRADSPAEARAAAERILAILESEDEAGEPRLLVERFVPGPEVAVEGILHQGELEIITVFDKPDPLEGPYFEETLYVSPSILSSTHLDAVHGATATAVRALGLDEGPFHAELRVPAAARAAGGDNDATAPSAAAVVVLEVAARTIGGRCSKAMLMADGSSLEELVIANALGASRPPARLASPCGVLMIPIPRSGTLVSVGGIDEVRALPGVTGVEITIPVGRPIRALPEGDRYLGFVFASGDSRAGVEDALRRAEGLLEVEIDPAVDARGLLEEPADTVS
ncbi:MAG TPA: ATP-grasp domain-containing protein [Acidimicrobiales bacterium]|nr:ATP-grasp domain-containing protein [Acidimicrobiales bacterium]